jgi:hypothetical protein
MTRNARPIDTAIILLAVSSSSTGCNRPLTDIVATNTEDVGDYSVAAERRGDTLRARVCVANPARADAVAERILEQLYGKGLRTIVLDLYRDRSSIRRVVWRSGARSVEPLDPAAPAGLCERASGRIP